jgi:hypothetical protein
MHTFLKIPRPVDIPGPLESEFPFIPVLFVILDHPSRSSTTYFTGINIPLDPRRGVPQTGRVIQTPQVHQ